jgi:hypothetical protein
MWWRYNFRGPLCLRKPEVGARKILEYDLVIVTYYLPVTALLVFIFLRPTVFDAFRRYFTVRRMPSPLQGGSRSYPGASGAAEIRRKCVSLQLVGAAGFEPATFWSQTRRATRLRYAPPDPALDTCFALAQQATLSGH